MQTLLWLGKWFLLLVAVCGVGMGIILLWDWFRFRRLPHAIWLARQEEDMTAAERTFFREIRRFRRLKGRGESSPENGRKTDEPPAEV